MFEKAVEIILDIEGPDSNDPDDPGGWTRFGISTKAHPEVDLACLTRQGACDIYRSEYWASNRCDDLPYWAALLVFDTAVNMGKGHAVRFLQQTARVPVDGKIGAVTCRVTGLIDPQEGIAEYMSRRVQTYSTMKGWPKYGRGWTRRCFRVAMEAARGD